MVSLELCLLRQSAKNTFPYLRRRTYLQLGNQYGEIWHWGHELGELDLAGIEVFKNNDGKIELSLRIDS